MRISYKSGMIRLNDSQWERIRDHFPEENIPDGRAGRKPTATRQVLEAVLWILNTGAQWHMLPQCYPNYKTVHRRFQAWCHNEVLRRVVMDIANELRERGLLDPGSSLFQEKSAYYKQRSTTSDAAAYSARSYPDSRSPRLLFLRQHR